jgi:hypothetical protein
VPPIVGFALTPNRAEWFDRASLISFATIGGTVMRFKSFQATLGVMLAALGVFFLAACGGGSSGPEAAQVAKTVVVVGKVALPTTAKAGEPMATLAEGSIQVTVEGSDPLITTTVDADGSFTLRGLPEGSFTLEFKFKQGDTELSSTLTFREVAANQQITISVQLVEGEIILVDEDRRGIGHAGVELQGLVENVIGPSAPPSTDYTFVIAGRTVIARPGVTAIREGITRRSVEDVTVGKQVHVKGTTEGSTSVLAYEIKLQNPTTTNPTDPAAEAQVTICHIPPGNPSKRRTLAIGSSAWPAHQAHGDTEGACPA